MRAVQEAERNVTHPTKIATCCYCGSRATLRLDHARHELACSTCGAPLRHLKRLPVAAPDKLAVSHQPALRRFPGAATSAPAPKKKRKVKRRKSWMTKLAEEVFDIVEDVLD